MTNAQLARVLVLAMGFFPRVAGAQAFNPFEKGQDEALESLLSVTVESASQQSEPLAEAPVPVTVITADMIRSIGARNLQDVLVTYVPGMSFVVDHNELNVAMRGVYASSQQKILVLLDGHRLNSRAYSMANPDWAIAIPVDRIKQIEVLRGPGSAVYGNVALAAVINIVSKSPREVNGAAITLGGGEFISSYNTVEDPKTRWLRAGKTASLVYGKEFSPDHNLLLWGSVFSADGQRLRIDQADDYSNVPRDGFAVLGGATSPASYDVGLKYNFGRFSLLANTRFGKVTEPFTSSGTPTGEVFNYDAYRTFWSVKPGIGSRSDHLQLRYQLPVTENFSLDMQVYYDRNDFMSVLVQEEALGQHIYLDWHEDDMGTIVMGRYNYDARRLGTGNLLAGAQLDVMRLRDSALLKGQGYDWIGFGDTIDKRVLEKGHEWIASGFVQLKHKLIDQLVLNIGGRFDGKNRHRGAAVYDFSPRLAAIWTPRPIFNVKLSYSQSFVDAPYWYRYNSLPSYQGADTLTPEHLRSIQLTPSVSLLGGKLVDTFNFFYDHLYDFVYRDNNAGPDDPKYRNAGSLKSIGAENELAYTEKYFGVATNLTYQYALSARDFGAKDGEIDNIPPVILNLVLNGRPLWHWYPNLSLNFTTRVCTEQRSPIASTFRWNEATQQAEAFSSPDNRVDAQVYINMGFRLTDLVVRGLDFDFTVYNLLDRKNRQGGSVVHPYPQAGRFLMGYLTYRIKYAEPEGDKPAARAEAEPM